MMSAPRIRPLATPTRVPTPETTVVRKPPPIIGAISSVADRASCNEGRSRPSASTSSAAWSSASSATSPIWDACSTTPCTVANVNGSTLSLTAASAAATIAPAATSPTKLHAPTPARRTQGGTASSSATGNLGACGRGRRGDRAPDELADLAEDEDGGDPGLHPRPQPLHCPTLARDVVRGVISVG